MKHIYILVVLISGLCYSQIPTTYYDSAEGLTGFALKTKLKTIVSNGHQARSYGQLYDGNGINGSNGYIDTHSDKTVSSGKNYESDGTLLDMYSENPSGTDPYNYNHGSKKCGSQSSEGIAITENTLFHSPPLIVDLLCKVTFIMSFHPMGV